MFSLIWAWTNGWANHRDAGNLRHRTAHYDVIVMRLTFFLMEDTGMFILHSWYHGYMDTSSHGIGPFRQHYSRPGTRVVNNAISSWKSNMFPHNNHTPQKKCTYSFYFQWTRAKRVNNLWDTLFVISFILYSVQKPEPTHSDAITWKPFHIVGPLWGESTGNRVIFRIKFVLIRKFHVFFVVILNKQLQCRRIQTSWRPCDVTVMIYSWLQLSEWHMYI